MKLVFTSLENIKYTPPFKKNGSNLVLSLFKKSALFQEILFSSF